MNPEQIATLVVLAVLLTWSFVGLASKNEDVTWPAIMLIILFIFFLVGYSTGNNAHQTYIKTNFILSPK